MRFDTATAGCSSCTSTRPRCQRRIWLRACAAARTFIDTQMTPQDLLSIMTFKGGGVRVKAGFHRRPCSLAGGHPGSDFRRRQGWRRNSPIPNPERPSDKTTASSTFSIPTVSCLRFRRRSPCSGLSPSKSIDLFCKRAAAERRRQSGPVTSHDQRRDSRQRRDPHDRRARPRRASASRRRDESVARRHRDVFGSAGEYGDYELPAIPGLALFAGEGHGGKALFDYNDLSRGIVDAADSLTSYYLIGYYSTHGATDGRFHRVRISLTGSLTAELSYRQGYFADKTFAKFTAADKERQLEDALMLENPVTDITIAMEVNYFQLNRAEYFVPVAVKIPGSELLLARRGGAQRTVIDFIGEVKDDTGYTWQNIRDRLEIKLSDDTAGQLATRPIQIRNGFHVAAGQICHQAPGEGRRDGQDRDVSCLFHDSQPEQGRQARAHQFGGAGQPARAGRKRSL